MTDKEQSDNMITKLRSEYRKQAFGEEVTPKMTATQARSIRRRYACFD
jgi:hypothetical protein